MGCCKAKLQILQCLKLVMQREDKNLVRVVVCHIDAWSNVDLRITSLVVDLLDSRTFFGCALYTQECL